MTIIIIKHVMFLILRGYHILLHSSLNITQCMILVSVFSQITVKLGQSYEELDILLQR